MGEAPGGIRSRRLAVARAERAKFPPSVTAAIREQLTLLTFLALFAGIVSTETYYAAFGVRYQLLDLPLPHLVYRGLTAIIQSWPLIVAYLIAMAWLAAGADSLARRGPRWATSAPLVTYGVIILVVAISYFAAIRAGQHSSQQDLQSRTSDLPVIQSMKSAKGDALPFQRYRLLNASKDTIIAFKATSNDAEVPFIHLLKREDVGEITLSR